MSKLTIGRVAKAGGVNVETIRYYQRRGLLEEPPKPHGESRTYSPETVRRIRFIKRAQALGFSLTDIAELLLLNDEDACAKSCEIAGRKLDVINRKILELQNMRHALADLMAQCDKKLRRGPCPIIQALQRESQT
jgi:MerR family transcriptional regulator, mercuric resistance operon regulatory protein